VGEKALARSSLARLPVALLDRAEQCTIAPALEALDVVRGRLLKRWAPAGLVRDRDWRVLTIGIVAILTALGTAVGATGYGLLFGPLLLGMPHLFFEARHLFFQRRYPRRWIVVGIAGAQVASVLLGTGIWTVGLACIAAIGVVYEPALRRRQIILLLGAALVVLAAAVAPTWSRFVLLHAHNCIPLWIWLRWRKRRPIVSSIVVIAFVLALGSILGGAFDAVPIRTPLADSVFSLTRITDAVAGRFASPWRHRLLMFFAFTQAFHYVIWLRLIPEDAHGRETPRTWRASWRAFRTECGPTASRLMLTTSLFIVALATTAGAVRTRAGYVTLSEFHATVELIFGCLLVADDPRLTIEAGCAG
jgi:hypothetical protein